MGQDPDTAAHKSLYGAMGLPRINGGGAPAEIWAQFTREALKDTPAHDFDLQLQAGADRLQPIPGDSSSQTPDGDEPGTDTPGAETPGESTTPGQEGQVQGQGDTGQTGDIPGGGTAGTAGDTAGAGTPPTGGADTGGGPGTGGSTSTTGGGDTGGGPGAGGGMPTTGGTDAGGAAGPGGPGGGAGLVGRP